VENGPVVNANQREFDNTIDPATVISFAVKRTQVHSTPAVLEGNDRKYWEQTVEK
jgi:hypothetical protein